ncbi:MAG: hypothetical protein RSB71_00390 [Bacilli bacterium]
MRINNIDYVILNYFNILTNDYILFTIDDGDPLIFLAKVVYKAKKIDFDNPDLKDKEALKDLIKKFLNNDKILYKRLETDQLKANKIDIKGCQKIQLTNKIYDDFTTGFNLKKSFKKSSNILAMLLIIIFLIILYIGYFI